MDNTIGSGPNVGASATNLEAPDLLVGKTLDGKYRIIAKLGAGGMGAVYKAEHSAIDRIVAIKVLHPHLVENSELLKRFQSEARVASKLRHPNAITTYDFGMYEGSPYIVMEFVEGRSLRQLIAAHGPLPIGKVKTIFEQTCSALAQAHDLGIVHRDLKPDNIMLVKQSNGTESAVVLDFGIAKVLTEQGHAGTVLTKAGTFFGTPRYASPEQVLEKPLDRRADIYSLGVILYEAISGDVPFDAPSIVELLSKHLNQEPMPLRQFRPELAIAPEIDEMVMKCLRKKPEERYQNLEELLVALNAMPVGPSGANTVTGVTHRPSHTPNRGPIIPVFGGLALVVIAGFAYKYWPPFPDAAVKTAAVEQKTADQKTADQKSATETVPQNRQNSIVLPVDESTTGAQSSSASTSKGSAAAVFVGLVNALGKLPGGGAEPPAVQDNVVQEVVTQAPLTQETAAPETVVETVPSDGGWFKTPPDNSVQNDTASPDSNIPQQDQTQLAKLNTDGNLSLFNNKSAQESDALKSSLSQKASKAAAIRYYDEGTKLMRQKKYAEAASRFESAIALRGDAIASVISLGNCYLRLNQNDKALNAFLQATRIDPNYGPAQYNLAAFYAVTGKSELALDSLRKAIHLDPRAKREAKREQDFTSLRNIPEFKALVE